MNRYIKTIEVKQQTELQSQQWGVYVNGKLVEGGFFNHHSAYAAQEWWKANYREEEPEVESTDPIYDDETPGLHVPYCPCVGCEHARKE